MGIAKKIVLLIVCGLIEFMALKRAEANYAPCHAANGASGDCIQLQSCPALYSIAGKAALTREENTLLNNSKCGEDGRYILFCCPKIDASTRMNTFPSDPIIKATDKACITPNGIKGNCIDARDCYSIRTLNQPVSVCGRENQVCCPDPLPSDRGELPLPPICGHIPLSTRISGGTKTDIDEFPWTAMINYSDSGCKCGGSLINERYVVTAAHCAVELLATCVLTGVRLGEWNTTMPGRDCQNDGRDNLVCATPHIDVNVEEQIIHPLYDVKARTNDIALLRLEKNVKFSPYVRPICIDTTHQEDNYENKTAVIAGWGLTEMRNCSEIKLKALVRVQTLQYCKNVYRTKSISEFRDTQMCVGGEDSSGTCKGDSGGGLMYQQKLDEQESYLLIGVVALGPRSCGQQGFPGVFTRVASFIDWIKITIKK